MTENLNNVRRIVSIRIPCDTDLTNNKLHCWVPENGNGEMDLFVKDALNETPICKISLDVTVEFSPLVMPLVKKVSRDSPSYNGTLWLPGSPGEASASSLSLKCRYGEMFENVYAFIRELSFVDNNTGKTLLDCSSMIGGASDCLDHWLDVSIHRRKMDCVLYKCTLKMMHLVHPMFEAGIISNSTVNDVCRYGVENWYIMIPIYSKRREWYD